MHPQDKGIMEKTWKFYQLGKKIKTPNDFICDELGIFP